MPRGLEDTLFNLKFTSKSLIRSSKKCEKNEKIQKKKVKTAIEKGNMEGARIYANNAIREKNQALNYLRMSSRIDGVAARVEAGIRMNALTKSMGSVVKGMDKALQSLDTVQIAKVMDKFEQQFDDMDVKSAYMESAMESGTATTTPVDEVESLIAEVSDEHGLKLMDDLTSAPTGAVKAPTPTAAAPGTDLEARLAALRR